MCGCRNKWRGATMGPQGRGARPRGVGAPSTLVERWLAPLMCSLFHKSSNILEKIIFNFQGIWRTFIFEVFLYCTDNQLTNRKIFVFILININNRKKWGTEGCSFYPSHDHQKESSNKVDQVLLTNSFRITWNRRNLE